MGDTLTPWCGPDDAPVLRLGSITLAPDVAMQGEFIALIRVVSDGQAGEVARMLAASPELVRVSAVNGATRKHATEFFYESIGHYLYAGDTALHMAAAAFERAVAELLVRSGADCRARNRRGAEPLHYAADANRWRPAEQRDTIEYLISVGADPNAVDHDGVTPIHRAVRTRASEAVSALLAGGADARVRNGSGSTPLHLAVRDTGRGGSGSDRARNEQANIIAMLLDAGAQAADRDGRGRSVLDAAANDQIRTLLMRV